MPKKKEDEIEQPADATAIEGAGDSAVEAHADAHAAAEATRADDAPAEKKQRKASVKKAATADTKDSDPSVIDSVLETVASAAETVVKTVSAGANAFVAAVTGSDDAKPVHKGKRAEKIGVVASDLMTKTVTVRVDRLVKHPVYRKYVRKRKKFMAHDELGAKIGDKVRIVETRPLSARKRWRVVEIIQKAER